MTTYYLPDDLLNGQIADPEKVVIRSYTSNQNTIKNRIALNQNMINLLVSGTKTIVYPDATATVNEGELVVLSTGNVLTSELITRQREFSSILLYFSNEVFNRFLVKYNHLLQDLTTRHSKQPFLIFKQDAFVRQYIISLQALLSTGSTVPADIMLLKLEELLLYLLHTDPHKFCCLQILSKDKEDLQLKKVVESHIGQLITVDELAFLCHMSTSTFKRKFSQIYGTSPQRWLLTHKLQMAAELLKLPAESPSGVYSKVGYSNHSSFSEAFRRYYGCTPSDYQTGQLSFAR